MSTPATYEEMGALLAVAGGIMARAGLAAPVILGAYRDRENDLEIIAALEDRFGIAGDRAVDLLGIDPEDLVGLVKVAR